MGRFVSYRNSASISPRDVCSVCSDIHRRTQYRLWDTDSYTGHGEFMHSHCGALPILSIGRDPLFRPRTFSIQRSSMLVVIVVILCGWCMKIQWAFDLQRSLTIQTVQLWALTNGWLCPLFRYLSAANTDNDFNRLRDNGKDRKRIIEMVPHFIGLIRR